MSSSDLPALCAAAAEGDQRAFDALVDRFGRLVWSVARSFRLDDASAADVSQTTWLRFVEQLSYAEIGDVLVDSVNAHDLPVVVGIVVLTAGFYVLANLLVDVAYTIVDPRLKGATA